MNSELLKEAISHLSVIPANLPSNKAIASEISPVFNFIKKAAKIETHKQTNDNAAIRSHILSQQY